MNKKQIDELGNRPDFLIIITDQERATNIFRRIGKKIICLQ